MKYSRCEYEVQPFGLYEVFLLRKNINERRMATSAAALTVTAKEVFKLKENKLAELSVSFSVQVIGLCNGINGHFSIVNQLERSATSIGANIHEANYAQSAADFISKLQIALKECYETEYWLTVFSEAGILDEAATKNFMNQCGTIRRILVASINTTKKNQE